MLDKLNDQICVGGNIGWGLAYHPYPLPLNETSFWDDPAPGNVSASEISFKNLHVLTDYLQQGPMTYDGGVRHVILTEQGFTSLEKFETMSQRLQAAAYAYAYYIVEANPYIDGFLLSRHVDNTAETAAFTVRLIPFSTD